MSSKPAPSTEILLSHERAFIQHNAWLIRWALQFTNNDRTRAEDLVQEVFAQFAVAHTDLSAVQNVPAYLYKALRNIYVSEVRMAVRSHAHLQSIIDFGVVDVALGASDPLALYQVQDQLRRVCRYACMRKRSSRAGSVFILRFFHGYHISEVAEVLGATSQAVRQCLRFARNEARLFLENPDALTFIDRTQVVNEIPARTIHSAEEFLTDLRQSIFRSCEGDCFATGLLREFYENRLILTLDNLALAHIVSCRRCLDGANRELGLPLLAERHPADALGPDNSWRGGSGSSGGTGRAGVVGSLGRGKGKRTEMSGAFLLRCHRRARELFEHYPRELRVSVNGHLLGSQSVSSDMSRLRLDITIAEPLDFIEVMSEEGSRLLVMNIEAPPDCEPTQTREVTLSEGRRIAVIFRYGYPWPMLEVIYEEPNFIPESEPFVPEGYGVWWSNPARVSAEPIALDRARRLDELRASRSPETHPSSCVASESPLPGYIAQSASVRTSSADLARYRLRNLTRRLRSILSLCRRNCIESPVMSQAPPGEAQVTFTSTQVPCALQEGAGSTSIAEKGPSKNEHAAELIDSWCSLYLSRRRLWSRPSFITGLLSLFIIAALLFVRLNITPTVNATTLLERARVAENAITGTTDQATRRVISLEERDHARGEVIARSRIEIWRDARTHVSARRVYNEQRELIAGEWSKSPTKAAEGLEGMNASSRTIYQRGERPRIDPSVRTARAALRNLDVWQLEPSATDYAELIGHDGTARVSEDSLFYVISYAREFVVNDDKLLQATLTLRKLDLHPVAQTLVMQQGSDVREYRFVEASFERSPIRGVASSIFEVDPELLSENIKREGVRIKGEVDSRHPSLFVPRRFVATPELELEAIYLLDQFRLKFGDQINLTKSSEGLLRIEGIVDSDASKNELLHALAPIVHNPAVTVQISTATEALQRQQRLTSDHVIVREFAGSGNAIPVYPELIRYFSRQGESLDPAEASSPSLEHDRADRAVRQFAARLVSRSSRASSHAIELKKLSERFSGPQLSELTPNARTKWFAMIRNHAGALQREASFLRQELQPIFFPAVTSGVEREKAEISDQADLALAIERLYKLAISNDEAIRSAFTVSSHAPEALAVKTSRFQVSLAMLEKLADSIRKVAATGVASLK